MSGDFKADQSQIDDSSAGPELDESGRLVFADRKEGKRPTASKPAAGDAKAAVPQAKPKAAIRGRPAATASTSASSAADARASSSAEDTKEGKAEKRAVSLGLETKAGAAEASSAEGAAESGDAKDEFRLLTMDDVVERMHVTSLKVRRSLVHEHMLRIAKTGRFVLSCQRNADSFA